MPFVMRSGCGRCWRSRLNGCGRRGRRSRLGERGRLGDFEAGRADVGNVFDHQLHAETKHAESRDDDRGQQAHGRAGAKVPGCRLHASGVIAQVARTSLRWVW